MSRSFFFSFSFAHSTGSTRLVPDLPLHNLFHHNGTSSLLFWRAMELQFKVIVGRKYGE
jgi:hypothetical protein